DLRTDDGRATLADLVAGADVLVQSFRPGTLAARGFGPGRLAELSPGIVVVDLSAYGHAGPWRARRGFDSLVQVASGIAADGMGERPGALPLQALDHGTGWLSAAAVTTALRRRHAEGGSWWVRPALARTGAWLDDLGRVPPDGGTEPGPADVAGLMAAMDSQFGRVDHVRVPGDLPGAQPCYAFGPRLPGGDPAAWE
ncbi:MAG TPA: CoA transferase, partial [Pseudonocardiaceae bacterium]|nr:CoA transferase [Pseudonocardiaceae bacterium]